MNWKRKNKSAWALYLPDSSQYNFFPICKILGNQALEKILLFNLKWQQGIFKSLALKKDRNIDIFVYSEKDVHYDGIAVKNFLKQQFPQLKFKHRSIASISNPNLNVNNSPAAAIETLQKLNYPFHSTAGKINGIVQSLQKQYNQVTVWNLESPVLNVEQFFNTLNPGEILKISSLNERLILLSLLKHNENQEQNFQIISRKIPAVFDLPSIQMLICHLKKINDPLTDTLAGELADVLKSILPNSLD